MQYLPFSVNPFGTVSNRWTFSKSSRNRGTNASTLPKVIRLMIDAPPGRIYISPDLPQADARVVAWDAQCLSMIQALSDTTRHIHLENCSRLFGHPRFVPDSTTAKEYQSGDEYKQGKAMLHAANYRMGPQRLAVELGVDLRRAKELLQKYFTLYPEITQWHNTIRDRICNQGYLETPAPFNRKRLFYTAWAEKLNTGKISTATWNSACSWIPQSAVADIINWGLRRLKNQYRDRVWLHKHDHDSYLVSIPWQDQEEIIPVAMEQLRITLTIHSRPLLMEPEMCVGYNYGLMVGWTGKLLSQQTWWGQVQGKLEEEKMRKELYGYV